MYALHVSGAVTTRKILCGRCFFMRYINIDFQSFMLVDD